jgi:hypothetical protein
MRCYAAEHDRAQAEKMRAADTMAAYIECIQGLAFHPLYGWHTND